MNMVALAGGQKRYPIDASSYAVMLNTDSDAVQNTALVEFSTVQLGLSY